MAKMRSLSDAELEQIPFGQRGVGSANPYRQDIRSHLEAGHKGGMLSLEAGDNEKTERARLVAAAKSEGWKISVSKHGDGLAYRFLEQIEKPEPKPRGRRPKQNGAS